jgi:hypothetical protein
MRVRDEGQRGDYPMIEQKDVAVEVSKLMPEFGSRLDTSVALIQAKCSATELQAYRRAIGKIMAEMWVEVMNPLYGRHPDLKPKELK